MFSSFDPDAALIMRALQGLYPVMMISDCAPHHLDPRRASVAAAKKTALEGGLCGLVLNVKVLADGPDVADDIRSSGLLLGTYGQENDDKPLASKQVEWGMCLVCTDNVAALAGLFNAGGGFEDDEKYFADDNKTDSDRGSSRGTPSSSSDLRKQTQSPGRDSATARRLLGESELDAVRNAPWYKLSEDGKKEHQEETKLKATGVPLSNRRTNSYEFLMEHRRQPGQYINRIGTVEALSALVTDDKAVASPSQFPKTPVGHVPLVQPKSLADHVPSAAHWKNGKNGKGREQNRLGVTQKGVWAMYPKYEGTAKKEIGDST